MNFIHKNKVWTQSQLTGDWINTLQYIHLVKRNCKKNELLIHAIAWTNLKNANQKPDTNEYVLLDPIYIKLRRRQV